MTASTNPGLDEGFLRRVGVASLLLCGLGGLFGAYALGWRWGVGFAVAGVWSVLNLKALEHLIGLSLRPAGRQPGLIVGAILIKLPVLYGIGGLIVVKGGLPLGSLLLGLAVPTLVMVLKAGGRVLAPRVALRHAAGTPASGENSESRTDGRDSTQ
jgi:hypothetical protein